MTGDLGLIHDMSSLPLIRRSRATVKVVVVNDGGGRIFETLPAAEVLPDREFERLMLAPSDLSIESLASSAGLEAVQVDEPEGLVEALAGEGSLVIDYRLLRD